MRYSLSLAVAVVLAVSLVVSACGRRGPLEPPPAAEGQSAGEAQQTADNRPHRPFILDGLIR